MAVSPLSGRVIINIIRSNVTAHDLSIERGVAPYDLSRGMKGATTGLIEKAVGGEEHRRLILSVLFREGDKLAPVSSKTLSEGEWFALMHWVDPHKDEVTNQWRSRPQFLQEARAVLSEALRVFYIDAPQAWREQFGEYDAGSLVGHLVAMGGEITEITEGGAENDDIVIKPTKSKKIDKTGTYLDGFLGLGDPDDDVKF